MAEYEKLSHEVVGTEEILRKSVFEKEGQRFLFQNIMERLLGM